MRTPAPSSTAEFDDRYFSDLEAARHHWWVRGMQEIGGTLLDASWRDDPPVEIRVLDAGCGSGNSLTWLSTLARRRPLSAVDAAPAAIESCRQVAPAETLLARASVAALPLRGQWYDLVVSLDVLQHLTADQEREALVEMVRVLKPGGRLLVRTNAAFGRARVAQREDWRLYRPATLHEALGSAGLDVEVVTPVNFLQGLWASLPRRGHGHGHGDGEGHGQGGGGGRDAPTQPGVVGLGIPTPVSPTRNCLLLAVLRAEARWLAHRGRRLPFGHSLYAVARRPSGDEGFG